MKFLSILNCLLLLAGLAMPLFAQEEEEKEPVFRPLELKSYLYFKVGKMSYDDEAGAVWLADMMENFNDLQADQADIELISIDEPDLSFRLGDHLRLTKFLGASVEFAHFDKTALTVRRNEDTLLFERTSFGFNAALTPQYSWDALTVYGIAGVNWVRTDITFEEDESFNSDGEAVTLRNSELKYKDNNFSGIFGAGVRYRLGPNIQFGVSYEQLEVDSVDLNTVSFDFGVVY